jgi:hypothetical protein
MNRKYFVDIGQKIHRLTVIGFGKNGNVTTTIFRCECGNIVERPLANIFANNIKSCGCVRVENFNKMVEERWRSRSSSTPDERVIGYIFAKYKGYARRAKMDFNFRFSNFCIVD